MPLSALALLVLALITLLANGVAAAADDALLTLRTGRHPGFERLVLQGEGAATLGVSVDGTQVHIGPGTRLRTSELRIAERLRAVRSARSLNGTLVVEMAETVGVKPLRLPPDRLVLDFFQIHDGDNRTGLPQKAVAALSGDAKTAVRVDDRGPRARPEKAAPEASSTQIADRPGDTARGDSEASPPPHFSEDPASGAASDVTTPAGDGPSGEPAGMGAIEEAQAGRVAISAKPDAAEPTLVFSWSQAVGAAAYRRSGRLWVVFDTPADEFLLDQATLSELAAHGLQRVRTYRQQSASLVELELATPLAARMRGSDGSWMLALVPELMGPGSVQLDRANGALRMPGARRMLQLRDPVVGDMVQVATAAATSTGAPLGRRLVDVVLLPSFQGLAWLSRADDVEARLHSDTLEIVRPNGLRLDVAGERQTAAGPAPGQPAPAQPQPEPATPAASAGDRAQMAETEAEVMPPQAITSAPSEPPATTEISPSPALSGLPAEPASAETQSQTRELAWVDQEIALLPPWETAFGLQELGASDEIYRRELRARVRALLATAAAERAQRLALELARLYLAEGFARETLVSLELAPQDVGDALATRRRALLAGAALALLGRDAPARALLAAPEFAQDAEVTLWLGWLDTRRGAWDSAATALAQSGQLLEAYPSPLRHRLELAALAAAIQTGDADRAYVWLDKLAQEELPEPLRLEARFLEAMTLARDGAVQEAHAILTELAVSADWRIAGESRYAAIDLARQFNIIGPTEALSSLSADRHLWRGHPWEARVLRRIGELQAELGQVYEALVTWREALDRFGNSEELRGVSDAMRQLYVSALDPKQPPQLPALEALRIYREFEELRPDPPLGTSLTVGMARALGEIGLPGIALTVLRSIEADAEQDAEMVGLKAELALAAGAPEQALAMLLKAPALRGEPAMLLKQAQALVELQRPAEALDLLESLAGAEAERLRADAAWLAGRDDMLAAGIEPLQALARGGADAFDWIRFARALIALAHTDPSRIPAMLEQIADDAPPWLMVLASLASPAPEIRGKPQEAAEITRSWAGSARAVLNRLGSPQGGGSHGS